jgi:fumarylacetoacetate (FAA) hydrolase family protein
MGYHASSPCLLAPCDFQAIKACGVTFASSMVERVIDERTSGNPARAEELRQRIGALIGASLSNIEAGSEKAAGVKAALIAEGLWSQYLEVGIGPDAEVFTKSQPMAAVGYGAQVGVNRISAWSNPEPEVVLAVDAHGNIRGATLGNDVNLRDVEGRSALLLGKAKDNNASCAIGPFIRLFDETFTLADIESAELSMSVTGTEGFTLSGRSNMAEISRKPAELVRQTMNKSHQYPDGFMLFLGTMFAPTQDRAEKGSGFTHKPGDIVEIFTPLLGTLRNLVVYSDQAPEWTFGTRSMMRNLAKRGLL